MPQDISRFRRDFSRQSSQPFGGKEEIGADMVMKDASRKAKLPRCILIDRDIAVGCVQAGYFHGIGLAEAIRHGGGSLNLASDDLVVDACHMLLSSRSA